jgi:putative serine protease PepD
MTRLPIPSSPRWLRAVLIALPAAILVAACSSAGTPTPGASAAASAGPASAPVTSPAGTGAGDSPAAGGAGAAGSPAPSAGGSGDPSGGIISLQGSFVSIVQKVNPSVVVIQTSQGLGSGVVFDSNGDILTNAHVAGSATSFEVTSSSGKTLQGTLVGTFVPDDVAVIKVQGGNLQPATFGDSANLKLGDIVLAIGNPLGLQSSVTDGIVSATGRTVSEPGGYAIPGMIQTSAAINPGNSGGALVDLAGEVIGIPTLAATDPQLGGSAPGIGFAISSDMATDIAHQLVENGHVVDSHRAYLGVQLADVQVQGALVVTVASGGPAAKAGIAAGDLIVSIDGQPTSSSAAASDVLATLQPGQTVAVTVLQQSGTSHTVQVTLGQYPGQG